MSPYFIRIGVPCSFVIYDVDLFSSCWLFCFLLWDSAVLWGLLDFTLEGPISSSSSTSSSSASAASSSSHLHACVCTRVIGQELTIASSIAHNCDKCCPDSEWRFPVPDVLRRTRRAARIFTGCSAPDPNHDPRRNSFKFWWREKIHKMHFLIRKTFWWREKFLQNAFCEFQKSLWRENFYKMHFVNSQLFCELYQVHFVNSPKIFVKGRTFTKCMFLHEVCMKIWSLHVLCIWFAFTLQVFCMCFACVLHLCCTSFGCILHVVCICCCIKFAAILHLVCMYFGSVVHVFCIYGVSILDVFRMYFASGVASIWQLLCVFAARMLHLLSVLVMYRACTLLAPYIYYMYIACIFCIHLPCTLHVI